MRINFTPEILAELREEISKSLKSALHVMFGLEVTLTTSPLDSKTDQGYKAYVELQNATTRACLVVTIPYDVAEQITICLGDGPDGCTQEMMQDATNEVANVVVHAVRTHLIFTQGITLDVKVPVPGEANVDVPNMDTISLYFVLSSQNVIDVDFSYSKGPL